MCPMGCEMTVTLENGKFAGVTGNSCPRGAKYAETEVTDPRRMLTTTVRIKDGLLPLLPVVSADVLPKGKVADCASYLRNVIVEAPGGCDRAGYFRPRCRYRGKQGYEKSE